MDINQKIVAEFADTESKLLVVTKYFAPEVTQEIIQKMKDCPTVIGFGENRSVDLLNKKIDRILCHFIGNIQSRQIPIIAEHCSVVHSLRSLKQAHRFLEQPVVPDFFVQVNVSAEPNKQGLAISEVLSFLQQLPAGFPLLGIAAIGAYTDDPTVKKREFEALLALRAELEQARSSFDHVLCSGKLLISAGTSIDYRFALSYGMDVVRLGRGLFV